MKIKRIEIIAFGKFKNFSMDFKDGFNLIYGKNEDGKSTVMAFIALMLYGNAGSSGRTDISKNIRKKYMPWGGEQMAGDIEIEGKGKKYRIHKEFKATSKSDKVSITDTETGEKLNLPPGMEIGKYFFGLDYQGFEKSIFGFDAEKIHGEENADISSKLSNISESGDENISYGTAIARLEKAKEDLISKRGNKGRLVEINSRIEGLREQIAHLKAKEASRANLKAEYESLIKEAEELNKEAKKAREYVLIKEKHQRAKQYRNLAELMGEEEQRKDAISRLNRVLDEDLEHFSQLVKKEMIAEENYKAVSVKILEKQTKKRVLFRSGVALAAISIIYGLAGVWVTPYMLVFMAMTLAIAIAMMAVGKRKNFAEAETEKIEVERLCKEIDEFLKSKKCQNKQELEEAYRNGIALEEELKNLEKTIRIFKETYEIPDKEIEELLNLAQDIESQYPIEEIKADQDEIEEQIRFKNNRLLEIKGQLGEAEDIGSLERELAELCLKQSEMEGYYSSLVIASEVMSEAADEMSRSFAPDLKKRASKILEKLTNGRYSHMSVSKSYEIEVKEGDVGTYRDWRYLSQGTISQSYLALRLALCEMLEDGEHIPLMLDDILSDYDEEREKMAAEFLEEYAQNGRQVLFFTCHSWSGKAEKNNLM